VAVRGVKTVHSDVPLRFGARDEEFLRRALGDAGPAVRRYIFGLCGNWHEAEDTAQEALLKAWRNRASFDGRAQVQTWLFTIARNHWLDRLRRRRVRPREEGMSEGMTTISPQPAPPAVAHRGELAEAVDRAMASLPPEQREALALRESKGMTFAQIAGMLGYTKPDPAAVAESMPATLQLKMLEMEMAEKGRERQFQWDKIESERNWQLALKKLDLEAQGRNQELLLAREKTRFLYLSV